MTKSQQAFLDFIQKHQLPPVHFDDKMPWRVKEIFNEMYAAVKQAPTSDEIIGFEDSKFVELAQAHDLNVYCLLNLFFGSDEISEAWVVTKKGLPISAWRLSGDKSSYSEGYVILSMPDCKELTLQMDLWLMEDSPQESEEIEAIDKWLSDGYITALDDGFALHSPNWCYSKPTPRGLLEPHPQRGEALTPIKSILEKSGEEYGSECDMTLLLPDGQLKKADGRYVIYDWLQPQ